MAFALVVGRVGVEFGEFFSYGFRIGDHPYVFSQLVLGTYITASSWVGWQKASSSVNFGETHTTVFGKGFLLLLIDLLLVVCYFIVVRSTEKPWIDPGWKVSLEPEIVWCGIIFSCYALWDI